MFLNFLNLALNCLYHTTTLDYVSLNLINPIPVIVPPFFQTPPLFAFLFRFRVFWLLLRNNDNGECKGCPLVKMIFQGLIDMCLKGLSEVSFGCTFWLSSLLWKSLVVCRFHLLLDHCLQQIILSLPALKTMLTGFYYGSLGIKNKGTKRFLEQKLFRGDAQASSGYHTLSLNVLRVSSDSPVGLHSSQQEVISLRLWAHPEDWCIPQVLCKFEFDH